MRCMTLDTGLWEAKSCPSKRASKTGLVIRCWDSMLIASASLMESLRLSRNPFRNRSNSLAVFLSPWSRIVLMRVMSDEEMSATSCAQSSQ
ncbi:Uncharacterised protein [Mycobacteroides abscessus subsp. abscessus]|nr:Uncharacterised protein [Mycobacteroides abscessus subsp. abscessus]